MSIGPGSSWPSRACVLAGSGVVPCVAPWLMPASVTSVLACEAAWLTLGMGLT